MSEHNGPTGDFDVEMEDWDSGEDDAELQDPRLEFEASTGTIQKLWAKWFCQKGGDWTKLTFYGKVVGSVPTPAHEAFVALEAALKSSGFTPKTSKSGTYNCRKIKNSETWSLHSWGVAIDVDWPNNPHAPGDPYSGTIKRQHVEAVLAIKNPQGHSLFQWGGKWRKPDRMHFQIDVAPDDAKVDWKTVPGGKSGAATTAVSETIDTDEEGQVLKKGAEGMAVEQFQQALLAWDAKALPKFGADGDFGSETVDAVKAFQKAAGLEETGNIDGVTAALLGPKIPA